ncbi:MAG: SGNH/GDSL hydrolase family protein [Eubacteriales bacterium]|nr:SGNH/GDSL hydrolase family protein [Eubacteriales bacterium]
MTYPEIHIWGDSLARGILYNEQKGRYAISRERCVTRLEEALDSKVVNHSNMGATVLDGLNWFEAFQPVPGALCAVEFGGNDCDLDWRYVAEHPDEPVMSKVTLTAFEEGLNTFVHRIRVRGMRPVLITPLPLHAPRYFAWVTRGLDADKVLAALGDVYHIYRWQERYAIAVRNVSLKTRCPLLDLRDVFLAQPNYEQLMSLDGIHPNDVGYRLLADAAVLMARRDLNVSVPSAEREAAQAAITAIPSGARVG